MKASGQHHDHHISTQRQQEIKKSGKGEGETNYRNAAFYAQSDILKAFLD